MIFGDEDERSEGEWLSDQYDEGDRFYTGHHRRQSHGGGEGRRKSRYTRRHAGGGPALSKQELESRKGNSSWCQKCLKRHVNKGYSVCFWCS